MKKVTKKKGTGTTPKEVKKSAKAKKPAPPAEAPVVQDQVFTDWRSGVSIAELVVTYKLTRSQCRRRLTDAAGGKDKFRELRSQGAGGTASPSGRRESGGRRESDPGIIRPPVVDDSKAKRVKSMKGWKSFNIYKKVLVEIKGLGTVPWREQLLTIYQSPKTGRRYVKARDNEPADLIHTGIGLGLPNARLKRLEKSQDAAKVESHLTEEKALLERGTAKLKAKRADKRKARKARKAAQAKATKTKATKKRRVRTHA